MSALALALTMAFALDYATGLDPRIDELDQLVTPSEKEFLLSELARIQPPERLRELASYGQRQLNLGGGFYGMLPEQLTDPDSIPVPSDAGERLEAALCLARQRKENLAALKQLNPDYALAFRGESLPAFLKRIALEEPVDSNTLSDLSLELDSSALTGFFTASEDGEVTAEEAAALAALPSNQAMLEHRRNLGYVPEPLPDTESLAKMIELAGSADPLDRLWCWINTQNAFDYADLVQNTDGYRAFLVELENHGGQLVDAALTRIARYTPPDTRFEATFAMTVGWAIRGWVTPEMAGLNIEQTKDDWYFLFGTMVEETYHRLQLQLFPTPSGVPATEFSDLVAVSTGDARYDRLFEILAYTVAEGAANHVRGPFAAADLEDKVQAGAELMDRFVDKVIDQGDIESADALLNEGLKGNGPLYGLGWHLAGLVAERDGSQAMGELQQKGPVFFFQRGASLSTEKGKLLLSPAVTAAVDSLEIFLNRASR